MPIRGEWQNPALRRCQGKRPYGRAAAAEEQARQASLKTGELIIAYECPDCGRFHIGHADRSQQLARIPHVGRLCDHCGTPIPEIKKQRARMYRGEARYCSDLCQKNASKQRWHARQERKDASLCVGEMK